jgi:hypothetical protein
MFKKQEGKEKKDSFWKKTDSDKNKKKNKTRKKGKKEKPKVSMTIPSKRGGKK